jgi:hypothetical protein
VVYHERDHDSKKHGCSVEESLPNHSIFLCNYVCYSNPAHRSEQLNSGRLPILIDWSPVLCHRVCTATVAGGAGPALRPGPARAGWAGCAGYRYLAMVLVFSREFVINCSYPSAPFVINETDYHRCWEPRRGRRPARRPGAVQCDRDGFLRVTVTVTVTARSLAL